MATENCTVCTKKIRIMTFKGTGVCSENCRKIRDGEDPNKPSGTTVDAGITNILRKPSGVDPNAIK
jgi:hypothetical protein